jgi:choline kinase
MKAIIFNSGLGSRMGKLTNDKPKCMVQLYNGETILERQIRLLSECGIKEFIITTGPFKEQLVNVTKKYENLKFIFVENPDYKNTNYIVSMNNANNFLDDDVLLMHGDLVFNKKLIEKILKDPRKSLCLYNEEKKLPEKDFKGRFKDNILKEVSINIFDDDCYAFQPLYKLSKSDIEAWKNKVAEFVSNGNVKVYAENALNEITDEISIYGLSYKNDYIEEIDNEDDYNRFSNEIKFFD